MVSNISLSPIPTYNTPIKTNDPNGQANYLVNRLLVAFSIDGGEKKSFGSIAASHWHIFSLTLVFRREQQQVFIIEIHHRLAHIYLSLCTSPGLTHRNKEHWKDSRGSKNQQLAWGQLVAPSVICKESFERVFSWWHISTLFTVLLSNSSSLSVSLLHPDPCYDTFTWRLQAASRSCWFVLKSSRLGWIPNWIIAGSRSLLLVN